MKIKCCGRLKSQKEDTIMESEDALKKMIVEKSALRLLDITGEYISQIGILELKALCTLVVSIMSEIMTESANRTRTETSCGCTDTHHKPMTVEIPGAGHCQYTGD